MREGSERAYPISTHERRDDAAQRLEIYAALGASTLRMESRRFDATAQTPPAELREARKIGAPRVARQNQPNLARGRG